MKVCKVALQGESSSNQGTEAHTASTRIFGQSPTLHDEILWLALPIGLKMAISFILGATMELQAVLWKEEDMYIIKEVTTGVTTQGRTIEEAIQNLKEALELYLEEFPEIVEKSR
ncbi:MAG: type II toxin-antitoxin system HicB family antitoxin [Thermofilum sp.]|nr:type II toxin-antitoxin system HicB family antitoxin [Thermofilum adornatum]